MLGFNLPYYWIQIMKYFLSTHRDVNYYKQYKSSRSNNPLTLSRPMVCHDLSHGVSHDLSHGVPSTVPWDRVEKGNYCPIRVRGWMKLWRYKAPHNFPY